MNRKDHVITTCLECGAQTERQPCFADRKFCDRQCSARYNQRLRRKREIKPCPECGVEFESLICHNQKYCSSACGNKGKQIKVDLICEECGEAYQRHTMKASQSRYCGNACKAIAGAARRAKTEMPQEEYDRRCREQDGKCALCKNEEVQTYKRGGERVIKLTKDHDHKTGEWRGLLCRRCNMALGLFGDNVTILLRAADYVLNGGVPHVADREGVV